MIVWYTSGKGLCLNKEARLLNSRASFVLPGGAYTIAPYDPEPTA